MTRILEMEYEQFRQVAVLSFLALAVLVVILLLIVIVQGVKIRNLEEGDVFPDEDRDDDESLWDTMEPEDDEPTDEDILSEEEDELLYDDEPEPEPVLKKKSAMEKKAEPVVSTIPRRVSGTTAKLEPEMTIAEPEPESALMRLRRKPEPKLEKVEQEKPEEAAEPEMTAAPEEPEQAAVTEPEIEVSEPEIPEESEEQAPPMPRTLPKVTKIAEPEPEPEPEPELAPEELPEEALPEEEEFEEFSDETPYGDDEVEILDLNDL